MLTFCCHLYNLKTLSSRTPALLLDTSKTYSLNSAWEVAGRKPPKTVTPLLCYKSQIYIVLTSLCFLFLSSISRGLKRTMRIFTFQAKAWVSQYFIASLEKERKEVSETLKDGILSLTNYSKPA